MQVTSGGRLAPRLSLQKGPQRRRPFGLLKASPEAEGVSHPKETLIGVVLVQPASVRR